jgi:hypothetical protein
MARILAPPPAVPRKPRLTASLEQQPAAGKDITVNLALGPNLNAIDASTVALVYRVGLDGPEQAITAQAAGGDGEGTVDMG